MAVWGDGLPGEQDKPGQVAYATLGEVMNTMAGVFGRHVEVPTI